MCQNEVKYRVVWGLDSPAAIEHDGVCGEIMINPLTYFAFDSEERRFITQHELAHCRHEVFDEFSADSLGLDAYLQQGGDPGAALSAIRQLGSHPDVLARLENLQNHLALYHEPQFQHEIQQGNHQQGNQMHPFYHIPAPSRPYGNPAFDQYDHYAPRNLPNAGYPVSGYWWDTVAQTGTGGQSPTSQLPTRDNRWEPEDYTDLVGTVGAIVAAILSGQPVGGQQRPPYDYGHSYRPRQDNTIWYIVGAIILILLVLFITRK